MLYNLSKIDPVYAIILGAILLVAGLALRMVRKGGCVVSLLSILLMMSGVLSLIIAALMYFYNPDKIAEINRNTFNKVTYSTIVFTYEKTARMNGVEVPDFTGEYSFYSLQNPDSLNVMLYQGYLLFGADRAEASIGDGKQNKIVFDIVSRIEFSPQNWYMPYVVKELAPPRNWPGTNEEFEQWFNQACKRKYQSDILMEGLDPNSDEGKVLKDAGYDVGKLLTDEDFKVTVTIRDPRAPEGSLEPARTIEEQRRRYNAWKQSPLN